jgi:hypothetical protein
MLRGWRVALRVPLRAVEHGALQRPLVAAAAKRLQLKLDQVPGAVQRLQRRQSPKATVVHWLQHVLRVLVKRLLSVLLPVCCTAGAQWS